MTRQKRWFFVLGGVTLFVFDRFLKMLFLQFEGSWLVVDPWLQLSLLRNRGLAFGIAVSSVWVILPTALVLLLLLWQLVRLLRSDRDGVWLSLFFIFLGAVSNFFDRVSYGFVIDYVHLGWYPVFNLADVMIVAGIIGLICLDRRQRQHGH